MIHETSRKRKEKRCRRRRPFEKLVLSYANIEIERLVVVGTSHISHKPLRYVYASCKKCTKRKMDQLRSTIVKTSRCKTSAKWKHKHHVVDLTTPNELEKENKK